MDNPNINVKNLQRRKSFPGPLRSIRPRRCNTKRTVARSSRLVLSKSNPYVGWFRHAPPVIYCSKIEEAVRGTVKKRRYVSTGHHFSTSLEQEERTKTLALYLQLKEKFQNNHSLKCQTDWLKQSGFLPGGNPSEQELQNFLNEQCKGAESSNSVLFKLACWILDVPLTSIADEHAYHPPAKSLLPEDSSSGLSDDESECSEFDNYDTAAGSRQRSISLDDTSSSFMENNTYLSSQAEAYTAFAAVQSQILDHISRTNQQSCSGSHDRLDYDITQMDIVRMNRVASRHLDVESIVRLPVVTFQPEVVRQNQKQIEDSMSGNTNDNNTDSSWMIVSAFQDAPTFDDGISSTVEKASEERDVCVICLEKFASGDRLRILPCSHSFHVGCIDRWLSGASSHADCYTSGCPTCKKHPSIQEPLDGSVPSWAFARLGDALARESQLHT